MSDDGPSEEFNIENHKEFILNTLEVYRRDMAGFFHQAAAQRLKERYPGITFGHLLASIKNFEIGSDESEPNIEKFQAAVDETGRLMAAYQGGYRINSEKGYCEMKYIYFAGLAYARQLEIASKVAKEQRPDSIRWPALELASKIVLLCMIGYLTNLVGLQGVDKQTLKRNLGRRVIVGEFHKDLGEFGCYLIFKCVSTAVPNPI